MSFHRTYDISCVGHELQRSALQNAIEAVNLACTSDTNAWLYVESKKIADDYNKEFDPSETMKTTLFNHMSLAGHSGSSIGFTIRDLIYLATDYASWKKQNEEHNSVVEGEKKILDEFRKNTLIPYYCSMSGGGSRTACGPIVNDFLEIYNRIENKWMSEAINMKKEVMDLLGVTDEEKLEILNNILENVYNSEHLSRYRDSLKKIIDRENIMNENHVKLVNEQIPILQSAIDSKNIVALKAALYPGWRSMRLMELKEYKEASSLLNQLEGT
jgi:hypothetical protein